MSQDPDQKYLIKPTQQNDELQRRFRIEYNIFLIISIPKNIIKIIAKFPKTDTVRLHIYHSVSLATTK